MVVYVWRGVVESERAIKAETKMSKRIPMKIRAILREAKRSLQRIYGKRLKRVILHGSYARGEATDGSDIDLIIVLQKMDDPVAELERISKEIHRIDFEHDTLISVIPIDVNQHRTGRLPLVLNARREGVTV